MEFQYSVILWFLWLLPGMGWLCCLSRPAEACSGGAAICRRADGSAIDAASYRAASWVKGSLLLLGLALLVVAAARPRFGEYAEKIVKKGVDCFVVLDVSRSMLAEDVAPNRLERAKSDIRDLLKKLVGDRVGLIVFAGSPVFKVPLTTDDGFFRTVLDEVDTHSAPRGGTKIGDAIRRAIKSCPSGPTTIR